MAERNPVAVRFGVQLRTYRTAKGLTQAELASRLNLNSYTHVAKFERGDQLPSFEVLVRLANVLSVSLDDFRNAVVEPEVPEDVPTRPSGKRK